MRLSAPHRIRYCSPRTLRRLGQTTKELLCVVLSGMQIGFPAMLVMDSLRAQVNVQAGQPAHVVSAANGSPVININPANAQGLSHNQYTDFSVGANGVVLNNSGANSQSQVAGWVQGNPLLGNNHASLILNEVTGASDSQLNGAVEVAGHSADLVIANPNGITCDGCGFINAPQVQLTTGQAQIHNGQLTGYDVQQGQIVIDGKGLNATGVDQVDLIARSVKVNAGLWGNDINLVTGANQVSTDLGTMTAQSGTGAKPSVAVDVSALGGMYGNSIHLIGTEQGVGVNSAGHLQAITGDIEIDVNGNLSFASGAKTEANGQIKLDTHGQGGISQAQDARIIGVKGVELKSNRLNNQGEIRSGADTQLHINGAVVNSGQLISHGNLALSAHRLSNNQGTLASKQGNVAIHVQAQTDNRDGTIQSTGNLALTAQGYNGTGGKLIAQGDQLTLNAQRGDILNDKGVIYSAGALRLNTQGRLHNRFGARLQSGQALTLDARALNNTQGFFHAHGQATLTLGNLNNHQAHMTSDGDMRLRVDQHINNQQGLIAANDQLQLDADSINNQAGRLGSVQAGIDLHSQQALNNQSGLIQASHTVTVASSGINNQSATISAAALTLNQTGYNINNQHGQLLSRDQLQIGADKLDNRSGLINGGAHTALNLTGDLDNRNTQVANQTGLYSGGDLHLSTQNLYNQQGQLNSGGDATLNIAQQTNNQQGSLSAAQSGSLTLHTEIINNQQGLLQAPELTIDAHQQVNNQAGVIAGLSTLSVSTLRLDNRAHASAPQTSTISGGELSIRAEQLDNQESVIYASTGLDLQGQHRTNSLTLQNQQGSLSSNAQLNLQAQSLSGDGIIFAHEQLEADLQQWDGTGTLSSQGNLSLSLHQTQTLTGRIVADQAATIDTHGHQLINQGYLAAGQSLTVTLSDLHNQQGHTIEANHLAINASGSVNNHGNLLGAQALMLNANQLTNHTSGTLTSQGRTQLDINGELINHGLINGTQTYIRADRLINTERLYGSHIAIEANQLINGQDNTASLTGYDGGNSSAGVIAARGDMDLAVDDTLNEEEALIYAGGSLRVGHTLDADYHATGTATRLINASADIEVQGNAHLGAQTVRNENRHLVVSTHVVSQTNKDQMAPRGNPSNRHDTADVVFGNRTRRGVSYPSFPFSSEDFYRWQYVETVTESYAQTTRPGSVRVGGNLQLTGDTLNQDSQIVVGGVIFGAANHLTQTNTLGERIVEGSGTVTENKVKCNWRCSKHYYERTRSAYNPAPVSQTITLDTGSIDSQTTTIIDIPPIDTAIAATPESVQNNAQDPSPTSSNVDPLAVTPSDPLQIRTQEPNTQLPNNALYLTNPDNPNGYLVETDPAFTNHHQWLGSDYMLDQLERDPAHQWQRLGDGFYEQQLINQQILAGTGRRLLGDYTNNEDQYKALMDAGVAFANTFGLNIGTELTAEQMHALTTDIVWLVKREVTLADGRTVTALVPKVYMRVDKAQINGDGALISANRIDLDLTGDVNNSGTLYGHDQLTLRADNLHNQNLGQMIGDHVLLKADNQLSNIGGVINGNTVTLSAHTIDIGSTLSEGHGANGSRVGIDQIGIVGAEGRLTLLANQDITLTAAQLSGDQVILNSDQGDIILDTLELSQSEQVDFGNRNNYSNAATFDAGTQIRSGKGGTILNSAQGNIDATAATLVSQGNVELYAAEDIHLNAGRQTNEQHVEQYERSKGFLSSRSTHQINDRSSDEAVVSQVYGANVSMHAGNTLNLEGTQVSAAGHQIPLTGSTATISVGGHINLSGTNGVNITTAQNHYSTHSEHHETFSGIKGQGFGVFIGSQKHGGNQDTQALVHSRANLQSAGGINIHSREGIVHTQGVIANSQTNNIHLSGVSVRDEAVQNQYTDSSTQYQASTGLTIGLKGGVLDAVQGIQQAVKHANDGNKSDELQQAYTTQAAISAGQLGYDIYSNNRNILAARQSLQQAYSSGDATAIGNAQKGLEAAENALMPSLGISFGRSQSRSDQTQITLDAQSSQFTAAQGHVGFTAHGRLDADGHRLPSDPDSEEGTIHLTGTQVSAQSIGLDANNHLILDAATNQNRNTSHNHSSGWGVGVDIGMAGISVNAHANRGNGHSNGNAIRYQGANLIANTITISSGGDTRLIGSTVKGNRIDTNIGGDLEITTLQDTSSYHSQQESQGVNVGYNFGTGVGSFGYNDNTATVDGDQASVTTQAGLYAGSEGMNLQVAGTTTLTGGVISSEASADKNHFSTGALVHTDLENHAQWEADQSGTNISVGTGPGAASPGMQALGNLAANATPGLEDGHNATGVSQATITENIQVTLTQPTTDGAYPLAGLNRDKDQINTGGVEQDVQGMMESRERMQVRQQNAQAFSKLGASIAGDIGVEMGWDPQSAQMAILHGAIGAIAAEFGGGDAANGAVSAIINKGITAYLAEVTRKNPSLSKADRKALLIAISKLIGTAIGLASGNPTNSSVNNIVAGHLTEFNQLMHSDYYGSSERESLLMAISECKNLESPNCQEVAEYFKDREAKNLLIIEEACKNGASKRCEFELANLRQAYQMSVNALTKARYSCGENPYCRALAHLYIDRTKKTYIDYLEKNYPEKMDWFKKSLFYANNLPENPTNRDILDHYFMDMNEGGEIGGPTFGTGGDIYGENINEIMEDLRNQGY